MKPPSSRAGERMGWELYSIQDPLEVVVMHLKWDQWALLCFSLMCSAVWVQYGLCRELDLTRAVVLPN